MPKGNTPALTLLGNIHYNILNGSWVQACWNRYVDELYETYGKGHAFSEAVKAEVGDDTPEAREAFKAARLIEEALEKTELELFCNDCGGTGTAEYEEENDEGEVETVTEDCPYCRGKGYNEASRYEDVSFGDLNNTWERKWTSKYDSEVDTDLVDDITGQSHSHSKAMDEYEARHKAEGSVKKFKYRGRLILASSKAQAVRKVIAGSGTYGVKSRRCFASSQGTATRKNVTFDYSPEDVVEGISKMGYCSGDLYVFTKLLGLDEDAVKQARFKDRSKNCAANVVSAMHDEVLEAVKRAMSEGGKNIDDVIDRVYPDMPGYINGRENLYSAEVEKKAAELESQGYRVVTWGSGTLYAVLYAKKSGKSSCSAQGVVDSEASIYADCLSRNFIGGYDCGIKVFSPGRCEGIGGVQRNVEKLAKEMGATRLSDLREATEDELADKSIHWLPCGSGKYSRLAVCPERKLWRSLTADEFYHPRATLSSARDAEAVKISTKFDKVMPQISRMLGMLGFDRPKVSKDGDSSVATWTLSEEGYTIETRAIRKDAGSVGIEVSAFDPEGNQVGNTWGATNASADDVYRRARKLLDQVHVILDGNMGR